MDDAERFVVTEDHLTLLRQYCPQRGDYGNSDWKRDIPRILGWELFEDEHGDKHLTKEQGGLVERLHLQTVSIALEIVLRTGAFAAGTYERGTFGEWSKVSG